LSRQEPLQPLHPLRQLIGRTLPGGAILPLRLFLGLSFLSAGFDKLTDPSYLDPNARNYIGQQITRMAPGTPLEGFLTNIAAPNATLFGVMTMGGEFCIGLAVLLGLLTRFSAVMGLLLNLTFFLSATWDVRPFYFGADLPYVVLGLTLALAGPGPFALDEQVPRWWAARVLAAGGRGRAPVIEADETVLTRRAFLSLGAVGLAGAILAGSGLGWALLHPGRSAAGGATATATPNSPVAAVPPTGAPLPPTATSAPAPRAETAPADVPPQAPPPAPPTAAPAAGRTLLAGPGALPVNQAAEFTLPTGEPAVLVHNQGGYSAYVAICTHEGCQVLPTGTGLLGCPCHGARFDPTDGAVVRGPARRPLSPVAIVVDPDGSVYLNEG
jgi:thiosulfate dehydrogenase [quinone] large subunit